MANNRLYVRDRETGETFLIAKTLGDGWSPAAPAGANLDRLFEWLEGRDPGASCGNGDRATVLELWAENDPVPAAPEGTP